MDRYIYTKHTKNLKILLKKSIRLILSHNFLKICYIETIKKKLQRDPVADINLIYKKEFAQE